MGRARWPLTRRYVSLHRRRAGAIGIRIARRLAAFDVTVTGVRRHPPDSPVPPFAAVYGADRLLDCVANVNSVIISAGHRAGRRPSSTTPCFEPCAPAPGSSTSPAAPSLDADAAIAHLNTGHLAGIGLDVFPTEPSLPTGH